MFLTFLFFFANFTEYIMQEKIKNLTNSVYKILEFFPESDPLKSRAKDRALAIFDNLNLISKNVGWSSFNEEKIKSEISENIDALVGYLWIAKNQSWLNSANFLIICSEYEKIKKEFAPKIILPQKPKQKEEKEEIKFSERQIKIIEFLDKNEKAQVADLLTILPNVTKRTIRRDLDELLNAGKIVRTGAFNQVSYQIVRMS